MNDDTPTVYKPPLDDLQTGPSEPGDDVLYISRLSTALGEMLACATDRGLCLLEFTDRETLGSRLQSLHRYFRGAVVRETHPHIKQARREVQEYLSGERRVFDVDFEAPGTAFQRSVWALLRSIPYGATWSYGEQARRLGRPRAVRAVANANRMNRLALIIPCHRVIGSDGRLRGYAGGLERKRWLLALEADRASSPLPAGRTTKR